MISHAYHTEFPLDSCFISFIFAPINLSMHRFYYSVTLLFPLVATLPPISIFRHYDAIPIIILQLIQLRTC